MTGDVAAIVEDVRARRDAAVREWAERLDGVAPYRPAPNAEVPRAALDTLASRVRRWHEVQRPNDVAAEIEPGVRLERRWVPLESVGVYVPRGLISTLVMCVVPAQVAGVERIVVVTPPQGADKVVTAAAVLGVEDVWAIGGPHAIAALAYGTETIEPVGKIVGPGNAFVNEAKLLVARDVAIDLPAGPSELVVVLGRGADRALAERELAAQREHGTDTVCRTIDGSDPDAALAEIESVAPEHVVLLGEAAALADRITNAGAIFAGEGASAVAGDYATGANHVLPTGEWARTTGGLGLETFLKPVVVQRLTAAGLAGIRETVEALASAEGMEAHARAVRR
jgi:histidinol dehydrogenase